MRLPLHCRFCGIVYRARTIHHCPKSDAALLAAIVAELDRQAWDPDTLDRIAERLTAAGYRIRNPAAC